MADDAVAAVAADSRGDQLPLLLSCWTDPKAGKQPCVEQGPAGHVPPVRTDQMETAAAESEVAAVDADLAEVVDSVGDAGSAALGVAVAAVAADWADSVALDAAAEGRGSASCDLRLLGSSENCVSESTLPEFATQNCNIQYGKAEIQHPCIGKNQFKKPVTSQILNAVQNNITHCN